MTNEEIVKFTIDNFEGHSFTDDPIDTGGATKFGITLRTLQYYRRIMTGNLNLIISKNDVVNLTFEEAIRIGITIFMIEPRINDIRDEKLKLITFDYYFHSGFKAIKDLQKLVGTKADGIIGPMTLKMVNGFANGQVIAFQLLTLREIFMSTLVEERVSQRRFMLGWWKRTIKLQLILSGLGSIT